eukprot:TRINITY_DN26186_c0_g1_i1.p1 TRINITY_DN26186_c0_g1~~TRINITY_DN26186_c0_g1_i1.p1  ORF type:complete len:904 (-),score=81.09 TRINITY_DN26186_c0_g1_i1:492-3203(-)
MASPATRAILCPVKTIEIGVPGTLSHRLLFTNSAQSLLSPLHDIPLCGTGGGFSFVCTTPAGNRLRYGIAHNEPSQPLAAVSAISSATSASTSANTSAEKPAKASGLTSAKTPVSPSTSASTEVSTLGASSEPVTGLTARGIDLSNFPIFAEDSCHSVTRSDSRSQQPVSHKLHIDVELGGGILDLAITPLFSSHSRDSPYSDDCFSIDLPSPPSSAMSSPHPQSRSFHNLGKNVSFMTGSKWSSVDDELSQNDTCQKDTCQRDTLQQDMPASGEFPTTALCASPRLPKCVSFADGILARAADDTSHSGADTSSPGAAGRSHLATPAHFTENAPWSLGFLSQTYIKSASPVTSNKPTVPLEGNISAGTSELRPLQVVDVSQQKVRSVGEVYEVKPLASFCRHGTENAGKEDCQWTLVAMALDDPLAALLEDGADVQDQLKGTLEGVRRWLEGQESAANGGHDSGDGFSLAIESQLSKATYKICQSHEDWRIHFKAAILCAGPVLLPSLDPVYLAKVWKEYTKHGSGEIENLNTRHSDVRVRSQSLPLSKLNVRDGIAFDPACLRDKLTPGIATSGMASASSEAAPGRSGTPGKSPKWGMRRSPTFTRAQGASWGSVVNEVHSEDFVQPTLSKSRSSRLFQPQTLTGEPTSLDATPGLHGPAGKSPSFKPHPSLNFTKAQGASWGSIVNEVHFDNSVQPTSSKSPGSRLNRANSPARMPAAAVYTSSQHSPSLSRPSASSPSRAAQLPKRPKTPPSGPRSLSPSLSNSTAAAAASSGRNDSGNLHSSSAIYDSNLSSVHSRNHVPCSSSHGTLCAEALLSANHIGNQQHTASLSRPRITSRAFDNSRAEGETRVTSGVVIAGSVVEFPIVPMPPSQNSPRQNLFRSISLPKVILRMRGQTKPRE